MVLIRLVRENGFPYIASLRLSRLIARGAAWKRAG